VIALSSIPDLLRALSRARDIDVEAYTLHGPVKSAVEAAARRGARVCVELERRPYRDPHLARENARLVAEMRGAGVDARLADPVHAKTIVADGELYLDDKNWNCGDLVLRTDASGAESIPMIKDEALKAEQQLIRGAGTRDDLIVESESFSCCNRVYSALDAAAKEGLSPRLLVCERELFKSDRERQVLQKLVSDGVRVRVCENSEKLAVAGDRAWIGSANATVAFSDADLPDWGLSTSDPTIVRALRGRIEAVWTAAKEFKG
jgi:hypothetical protein